jgi:hypothetical protein
MGGVAVLFWFYRDLPVCRNRLAILRARNPGTPIFGLYGGDPREVQRYRSALGPQLDDFWAFDAPVSPNWKWRHGDLVLAAWYEQRGRDLDWRHVFVAQWDLLALQPVGPLVEPLREDDVLLSGVRPVHAVADRWVWVRGGHEAEYRAFLAGIEARFGTVEPMSCVFVVAALTRAVLAAYRELPDPEVGFVEYRLPTLAVATGARLVEDERLSSWRPADLGGGPPSRRQRLLNGSRRAVALPTVLSELRKPDGARLFHPYHGLFPASPGWALRAPGWAAYSAARAGYRAVSARAARRR